MTDAVIVGAGPNGLAAAVTLAERGARVLVLEGNDEIGGAVRTAELTLPGFQHDLGAAVFPLAIASPAFRKWPLEAHGLQYIQPPVPLAHLFDFQPAALLYRDVVRTARELGDDEDAYFRFVQGHLTGWDAILSEILQPLLHLPRHLPSVVRFGLQAILPASMLANRAFRGDRAKALFAGNAAHAALPLEAPASAGFGIVLQVSAHTHGWPIARGGAGAITAALASYLRSLGGEIVTGNPVRTAADLPPARVTLFDVTPRQLVKIAGDRLPVRYRARLDAFRYGAGAFKIDYALHAPIPWSDPRVAEAGTVHLGGPMAEVADSERRANSGLLPERPFLLLAQPSLFDPSRAPDGKHTAWVYGHVPNGSTVDITDRIERQIERFAPGFRDCVIHRTVSQPRDLERTNPNLVGGDVNGGSADLIQLVARPVLSLNPYRIPVDGWFLCSASTPPGGAVHGMCGHLAAMAALASL
jgi:phytoene dehydrogenase-like protein